MCFDLCCDDESCGQDCFRCCFDHPVCEKFYHEFCPCLCCLCQVPMSARVAAFSSINNTRSPQLLQMVNKDSNNEQQQQQHQQRSNKSTPPISISNQPKSYFCCESENFCFCCERKVGLDGRFMKGSGRSYFPATANINNNLNANDPATMIDDISITVSSSPCDDCCDCCQGCDECCLTIGRTLFGFFCCCVAQGNRFRKRQLTGWSWRKQTEIFNQQSQCRFEMRLKARRLEDAERFGLGHNKNKIMINGKLMTLTKDPRQRYNLVQTEDGGPNFDVERVAASQSPVIPSSNHKNNPVIAFEQRHEISVAEKKKKKNNLIGVNNVGGGGASDVPQSSSLSPRGQNGSFGSKNNNNSNDHSNDDDDDDDNNEGTITTIPEHSMPLDVPSIHLDELERREKQRDEERQKEREERRERRRRRRDRRKIQRDQQQTGNFENNDAMTDGRAERGDDTHSESECSSTTHTEVSDGGDVDGDGGGASATTPNPRSHTSSQQQLIIAHSPEGSVTKSRLQLKQQQHIRSNSHLSAVVNGEGGSSFVSIGAADDKGRKFSSPVNQHNVNRKSINANKDDHNNDLATDDLVGSTSLIGEKNKKNSGGGGRNDSAFGQRQQHNSDGDLASNNNAAFVSDSLHPNSVIGVISGSYVGGPKVEGFITSLQAGNKASEANHENKKGNGEDGSSSSSSDDEETTTSSSSSSSSSKRQSKRPKSPILPPGSVSGASSMHSSIHSSVHSSMAVAEDDDDDDDGVNSSDVRSNYSTASKKKRGQQQTRVAAWNDKQIRTRPEMITTNDNNNNNYNSGKANAEKPSSPNHHRKSSSSQSSPTVQQNSSSVKQRQRSQEFEFPRRGEFSDAAVANSPIHQQAPKQLQAASPLSILKRRSSSSANKNTSRNDNNNDDNKNKDNRHRAETSSSQHQTPVVSQSVATSQNDEGVSLPHTVTTVSEREDDEDDV